MEVRKGRPRSLAPNAKLRSQIVSRPARARYRDLKRGLSRTGRIAAHELGPTAQTGLRYRCGTLPELRLRLEDHRRDRRSAGDRQDPQPSGPSNPRPAALPSSSSRSIPNDLNKLKPLANASPRRGSLWTSTERRDKESFTPFSTAFRPLRPLQPWLFHQAQTEIDNPPNPAI